MRNFFWSGDPLKKSSALIAWSQCCLPKDQGGLGLKNLFTLNRALLLKRCWDLVENSSPSATLLRGRFFISNLVPTLYYQKSSIWLGLKKVWPLMLANIRWLVGDGLNVLFWKDNWLGTPLSSLCNIDPSIAIFLNDRVSDFIIDHHWNLPVEFSLHFPEATARILEIALPVDACSDQAIWPSISSGQLNAKASYDLILANRPTLDWGIKIWHRAIQPRKSMVTWKVLHGRILVDTILQRRGAQLCSQCSFCLSNSETVSHLFLDCPIILNCWDWILSLFHLRFPRQISLPYLLSLDFTARLPSSGILMWKFAFCNFVWCIWTERNKLRYNDLHFCLYRFNQFFILSLKDSASIIFAPSASRSSALPIFNILGLSSLNIKAPKFIPVSWHPPPLNWLKVNTDGSFKDANHAGFGGIFRDSNGIFQGAFSFKVAVPSAIDAEVLAVIEALRIAWVRRWTHIWLETDSTLVVRYFHSPHLVPWRLRIPWLNCFHIMRQINLRVSHVYREGNVLADLLANFGAVHVGSFWWDSLPMFLATSYGRDLASAISYRYA